MAVTPRREDFAGAQELMGLTRAWLAPAPRAVLAGEVGHPG